jgi:dTDP-4-amino-4,6-dideoxygalactose transaminase
LLHAVSSHPISTAFQQRLGHPMLPPFACKVQRCSVEACDRLSVSARSWQSALRVHVAHERQQQIEALLVRRQDADMKGGMALTNNQSLVKRMARLRSHGITRYPEEMTHIPDGPWYYQQIELGFNYRMTEIQAALGFSQMSRLDSFVSERHEVAKRYDQLLSNSGIKLPWQDSQSVSAFHLYVVRIPVDHASLNRNAAFDNLRTGGVGVNLHYIPVYKQPYYQAIGFDERDFSESERYYEEAISLPMYPGLELIEQKEVVHLLTGSAGYQTIF